MIVMQTLRRRWAETSAATFSSARYSIGGSTRSSSIATGLNWQNAKDTEVPNPISADYLVKTLTSRVYEVAKETDTGYAATLSSILENDIFLKREDTQPVFSFKIRGAYNKIASLSKQQLEKGVVTCSAGNHAQGVALSATKLGIHATVVMPEATPTIKVDAVRRFGGSTVTVLLHGKTYDEAAAEANRLVHEKGLTMVHPFDDEHVIAGQGTIGMEILKSLQGKEIDTIFVCTGGGGMLAGVATYIKAVQPRIKVIGVESEDAAGMTASLTAGKVVTLPAVGLFADGAAVKTIGTETFRVCDALVDGMITVKTDEICAAIKNCFNDTRCVLEPAGALAVAGVAKYIRKSRGSIKGKTMVAITSGANMDFDRLRFVSERADSSETLMSIAIPDRPGSFRELYSLIYPRSVTEFSYRYSGGDTANIVASIQLISHGGAEGRDLDKTVILESLQRFGYEVKDLSDNELAKDHIRHLAGGRAAPTGPTTTTTTTSNPSTSTSTSNNNYSFNPSTSTSTDRQDRQEGQEDTIQDPITAPDGYIECVYRFEFPESPGALGKFLFTLTGINRDWNITLFHYRSHGHDYGRVLVGLMVKEDELSQLRDVLDQVAYTYYEESSNDAFIQFLK